MEWKELLNKSEKELNELLASLKDELRDLKFIKQSNKKVHKYSEVKKTIAKILTLLNQRKEK